MAQGSGGTKMAARLHRRPQRVGRSLVAALAAVAPCAATAQTAASAAGAGADSQRGSSRRLRMRARPTSS